MTELESRAEVIKLARELAVDERDLEFLAAVPARDLRHLRQRVSDSLHDTHRAAFQRASAASALLPAAMTAKLSQSLIGPELSARIAGEMPADRAVRLAEHLDLAFLADVTESLDPNRAGDIVRGMPQERVLDVADELLRRGEHVTVGRFVDAVSDDVLRAVVRRIDDDAALLEIAFSTEAKHRLDDVVAMLDDDRIRAIVRTATEEGLENEALTLIGHLGPEELRRTMDVLATAGSEVLERLVETTHREGLWRDVLPLLAAMSPERREVLVNLPVTADPEHLRAIVAAARDDDLWAEVLQMVELMDDAHLEAVGGIDDVVTLEVLTGIAAAAEEHGRWPALVSTLSRAAPAAQQRAAEVLLSIDGLDVATLLPLVDGIEGAADLPLVQHLRARLS